MQLMYCNEEENYASVFFINNKMLKYYHKCKLEGK